MDTAFIGFITACILSIAAQFPHLIRPLFQKALTNPRNAGRYQFYELSTAVALLVAETFVVARTVDKNVPALLQSTWWEMLESGQNGFRLRLRIRYIETYEQRVPAAGNKGTKLLTAKQPFTIEMHVTCIPYEARKGHVPLTAIKFDYLSHPRSMASPSGLAAFHYTVNQINLALAQAETAEAQRRPVNFPKGSPNAPLPQSPHSQAPVVGSSQRSMGPSGGAPPVVAGEWWDSLHSMPMSDDSPRFLADSGLVQPPVSWPTPQEYNECMQNPGIAFSDEQLRAGTAELNQLGLPRPISGAFASVYKVYSGHREWAVKCFLSPMTDQARRYRLISDHLKGNPLSSTVAFEYMEKGVFVRGTWFPVLKMEWVEGTPLNEYIKNIHWNAEEVSELADQFLATIEAVHERGIAHGDLQHGNILVHDGKCRLVDYDGMFVPAMQGLRSCELGHRNYQHPQRGDQHFDATLDNFSAWVIYLSLKILAADRRLWEQFCGGDECILFRQADFMDPAASMIFRVLEKHDSPEVRASAEKLRSLCRAPIEQVPQLSSATLVQAL